MCLHPVPLYNTIQYNENFALKNWQTHYFNLFHFIVIFYFKHLIQFFSVYVLDKTNSLSVSVQVQIQYHIIINI